MKKRVLAMIFAAFMALALTACGGDTSTTSNTPATDTPSTSAEGTEETTEPEEAQEPETTDAGTVGDYQVAIGDCAFGTDYEGNKMIVINYDFTNNGSEGVMPLIGVSMKAFQDGVELETAIAMDATVYDAGIAQKEVKPGASLAGCQNAYVLTSESPVEVEVGPLFGDAVLFKTFEVQ